MKPINSIFKREAVWMTITAFGIPLIGLLLMLIVWFFNNWHSAMGNRK